MYICLILGVFLSSGTEYFDLIAVFTLALYVTYFIINKWRNNIWSTIHNQKTFQIPSFKQKSLKKLSALLLGIISCFIVLHYFKLGSIPVVDVWLSYNYDEIVAIRKSITSDHGAFWNYGMSFCIKGLIPFMLVYYLHKNNKRHFLFLLVLSAVYAFSLIQKNFTVYILLPLLIYCVLKRNWIVLLLSFCIIMTSISTLVIATNPILRNHNENTIEYPITEHPKFETEKILDEGEKSTIISNALIRRVFYVPGNMVSEWFRLIPKEEPYLYGNGYRFIAPFSSKPFIDYGNILYPKIYPHFAKRGYSGTVNAASFVYDYANFGVYGLVISGILLAILFNFIEIIFSNNLLVKICFNGFHVLMLSSASMYTLLLSGGWILIILLYKVFTKDLISSN